MELAQRGHEVHFISYAHPIRLDASVEGIHYHEVEVANYPLFAYPPYTLALAARMAEVAERYDLDLLHVHYAIPHSISALLARQMLAGKRHLPFVTTLHGTDITLVGAEPSYFEITRFSIEQSDAATTVSDYLKQRTIEVFGVGESIETIHNFVNCERYKPVPGVRKRKRLMHLSNFRPVKRAADCLELLARVVKEVDADLWMAGDGPERGHAERLAWELGLGERVKFLGKQDQIEKLLQMADVVLMPSDHEAFGLVALEAMACGVPTVATRVGGVSELITHGVDGYMEAVGKVDLQAERVIELLQDHGLYARMSGAARRTAESRFSTDLIVPKYEAVYRKVVER
jgi:N-acetyl-alpha-D-glucosaminyl L-malate synthase BshA